MALRKRYRRLQGSSAYYPFGLRIALRRRQRRHARVLRLLGALALLAAAALVLRQTVFRFCGRYRCHSQGIFAIF